MSEGERFRTIREVAELLGIEPHVLRFWEEKFPQVAPMKRAGGRRYYRTADVEALRAIQRLLKEERLTIEGARRRLESREPVRAPPAAPMAAGLPPAVAAELRDIRDRLRAALG